MTTRTGSRQAGPRRGIRQAAKALGQELGSLKNNKICIALAGGRSAEQFYPYLKKILNSDSLAGKRIELFLLDERLSTRQRNSTLIMRLLGRRGRLPKNLRLNAVGVGKPAALLRRYNSLLKKRCPNGFDLVIAGVGEDGHIASLFPNSRGLSDKSYGYLLVEDSPKPPRQRLSASPRLIAGARFIYLLFLGESKRKALSDFINPKICIGDCPAKLVHGAGRAAKRGIRIISGLDD